MIWYALTGLCMFVCGFKCGQAQMRLVGATQFVYKTLQLADSDGEYEGQLHMELGYAGMRFSQTGFRALMRTMEQEGLIRR